MQASCAVACAAIKLGPRCVTDRLEERHILNNSPRIAADNNLGYVSTSQVNVANVESWDSSQSLTSSLGTVGEAHWDIHDDPLAMTAMTCMSSLPTGYDPGFFFLLEFGFFIRANKHTTLVFSGLHRHGGTPPRAPPGIVPAKSAARITIIWYPAKDLLDRIAPISLFKMEKKPLKRPIVHQPAFSIEMPPLHDEDNIDILYKSADSELASMIQSGHRVMSPFALRQFIVRELSMFTGILLSQLHPSATTLVDMDKLTSSFYYFENGQKKEMLPWTEGPNGSQCHDRVARLKKLRDVSNYLCTFIPSVGTSTS